MDQLIKNGIIIEKETDVIHDKTLNGNGRLSDRET